MSQILFKQAIDVTDEWANYILNEARALSFRDEYAIDNYMDREVLNPEMNSFLSNATEAENLEMATPLISKSLTLNYMEEVQSNKLISGSFHPFFNRLKEKIRKIFCEVTADAADGLDLKEIIKLVLLALIPVFAGGVYAVLLPVIIGIIAGFIKWGYVRTCPVLLPS